MLKILPFLLLVYICFISCKEKQDGSLPRQVDIKIEYYDQLEIDNPKPFISSSTNIKDMIPDPKSVSSIKAKGTIREGLKNGIWTFYDKDGNVSGKSIYVLGRSIQNLPPNVQITEKLIISKTLRREIIIYIINQE